MRIPADAIIADSKLADYLLKPRDEDDKSRFLALGGFSSDRPTELLEAIRLQSRSSDAVLQRQTPYGDVYTVDGDLSSPDGRPLAVTTVWIVRLDGQVTFVTLVPRRPRA